MENTKITVEALVNADRKKVWDYYTEPIHITKWNFANDSWHCPRASNDIHIGGIYKVRMEAKDDSFGFDLEAVYTEVNTGNSFTYEFGGRKSFVRFDEQNGQTKVTIQFDAEKENSPEMQKQGWQAILNNFKTYTEAN